ncbi:class I SAM-dependent methyltransferase [Amycolatopsis pigmentata]|uniref:Class I SAM-dependent methyltransferase n=1 Tax=Amycolatopsis pigmentata TaxID=450801 RepID=A0ABW5G6B9_9PSEU
MPGSSFEELLAEGASIPVDGWDFSWFEGRATEERPSWAYAKVISARMRTSSVALDVQTGGGEVLARIPRPPSVLVATESWLPNLLVAKRTLAPLGAVVVHAADDGALPFRTGTFDLVVSRHPVVTRWDEISRVLAPGGAFLSQQVGVGSVRELADYLMGPQPVSDVRNPRRAVSAAESAGLVVTYLREQSLETVFYDIAAVVHFLRKVIWIVPGFTVDRYRDRLAALHDHIEREGSFVAHAQRFLIEARKPD